MQGFALFSCLAESYSVCNIVIFSIWIVFLQNLLGGPQMPIWMKLTFRCLGDILTWEIGLGRHWWWWGHNFEQNTEMQHRTVAAENRKLATRRGGEEGVGSVRFVVSLILFTRLHAGTMASWRYIKHKSWKMGTSHPLWHTYMYYAGWHNLWGYRWT